LWREPHKCEYHAFPFSEILHFTEVLTIVGVTIFAGFQLQALRLQTAADQLQKTADFALRLGQEHHGRILFPSDNPPPASADSKAELDTYRFNCRVLQS